MKQPDPDVVTAEVTQSSNQLLLSSNETRNSNGSENLSLILGSATADFNTSTVDSEVNLTTTVPSNGKFKDPIAVSNRSSSGEIDYTASYKARLSSTRLPVNSSKFLHKSSNNDSETLNNKTFTNVTNMKILPTLATTLMYLSVLDVNHSSVVDVGPSVDVMNAGNDNHTTHFHQVPVTWVNLEGCGSVGQVG